jgi:hypothetical protein
MSIILSWIRQNLVTVIEIVEIIYDILQFVVNAAARIVAFTPSVKDDTFVAKIHDYLKFAEPFIKKAKNFLLRRVG